MDNDSKNKERIKEEWKKVGMVLLIILFLAGGSFIKNNSDVKNYFQSNTIKNHDVEYKQVVSSPVYTKWEHMPLTYSFINVPSENGVYKCLSFRRERVESAFKIIEESSNNISFRKLEDNQNADIKLYCLPNNPVELTSIEFYGYDLSYSAEITLAEAEPTIINKKIKSGKITFYRGSQYGLDKSKCPSTELHEILHLFNFKDNSNEESIMYREKVKQCKYNIDEEIINELNNIY